MTKSITALFVALTATAANALPCAFIPWIQYGNAAVRKHPTVPAYLFEAAKVKVDADGAPNAYHPADIGLHCTRGTGFRGLDCPANAGYETGVRVRRYAIGKTREDPATDLGEMALTAFPEEMEPAFIINAASARPTFVSLVAGKGGFKLLTQIAVPKTQQSVVVALECFRDPNPSWLRRPPALVHDRQDPSRSFIVFSRVRLNDMAKKEFAPAAWLELAVATLANGQCSGVQESTFPAFFEGFIASDELAAAAAAKESNNADVGDARSAFGRFAERVRGGQMVLADVTGDGVPDLVQISRMPRTLHFRTALLAGRIDASGLHFHELAKSRP